MRTLGHIFHQFKSKCPYPMSPRDKVLEEQKGLREALGIIGEDLPTKGDNLSFDLLKFAILNDFVMYAKRQDGSIINSPSETFNGMSYSYNFTINGTNYKVVESSHYFGAYFIGDSYSVYVEGDSLFSTEAVATKLGGILYSLIETENEKIMKKNRKRFSEDEVNLKKQATERAINRLIKDTKTFSKGENNV